MRPELLSQRGPTGPSTSACALRLGAAATVTGQLAHNRLGVASQPTRCHTPGLARDSAPSNPYSGRRGDAVIPLEDVCAGRGGDHLLALPGARLGRHPAVRPATHCPARPATRRGVTAPPSRPSSKPLTKGGESLVGTKGLARGSAPATPTSPALRWIARARASPPFPRDCRGSPATVAPPDQHLVGAFSVEYN